MHENRVPGSHTCLTVVLPGTKPEEKEERSLKVKRKETVLLIAIGLFAVLMAFATMPTYAADAKQTITGTVQAEYDEEWEIQNAQIVLEDKKEVHVVLDAKGLDFIEECNGHKVEATGTVSEKDGKKWIKIETYKILDEEEEDEEEEGEE
jgi:hypothetical protein